jgi:hypothetical protein
VFQRVYGEVVCVDDARVRMLDRLEGHPTHYVRQHIDVEIVSEVRVSDEKSPASCLGDRCAHCYHLSPGSITSCQAYLFEDFKDHFLNERFYDSFVDGADDKYYVCPQDRPKDYWPDYFRAMHKSPYLESRQGE